MFRRDPYRGLVGFRRPEKFQRRLARSRNYVTGYAVPLDVDEAQPLAGTVQGGGDAQRIAAVAQGRDIDDGNEPGVGLPGLGIGHHGCFLHSILH